MPSLRTEATSSPPSAPPPACMRPDTTADAWSRKHFKTVMRTLKENERKKNDPPYSSSGSDSGSGGDDGKSSVLRNGSVRAKALPVLPLSTTATGGGGGDESDEKGSEKLRRENFRDEGGGGGEKYPPPGPSPCGRRQRTRAEYLPAVLAEGDRASGRGSEDSVLRVAAASAATPQRKMSEGIDVSQKETRGRLSFLNRRILAPPKLYNRKNRKKVTKAFGQNSRLRGIITAVPRAKVGRTWFLVKWTTDMRKGHEKLSTKIPSSTVWRDMLMDAIQRADDADDDDYDRMGQVGDGSAKEIGEVDKIVAQDQELHDRDGGFDLGHCGRVGSKDDPGNIVGGHGSAADSTLRYQTFRSCGEVKMFAARKSRCKSPTRTDGKKSEKISTRNEAAGDNALSEYKSKNKFAKRTLNKRINGIQTASKNAVEIVEIDDKDDHDANDCAFDVTIPRAVAISSTITTPKTIAIVEGREKRRVIFPAVAATSFTDVVRVDGGKAGDRDDDAKITKKGTEWKFPGRARSNQKKARSEDTTKERGVDASRHEVDPYEAVRHQKICLSVIEIDDKNNHDEKYGVANGHDDVVIPTTVATLPTVVKGRKKRSAAFLAATWGGSFSDEVQTEKEGMIDESVNVGKKQKKWGSKQKEKGSKKEETQKREVDELRCWVDFREASSPQNVRRCVGSTDCGQSGAETTLTVRSKCTHYSCPNPDGKVCFLSCKDPQLDASSPSVELLTGYTYETDDYFLHFGRKPHLLFDLHVVPILVENGWKCKRILRTKKIPVEEENEQVRRQQTNLYDVEFVPPGILPRRPFVKRKDYFDSRKQLRDFFRSTACRDGDPVSRYALAFVEAVEEDQGKGSALPAEKERISNSIARCMETALFKLLYENIDRC